MRTNGILNTAIVAMTVTAALGAQSAMDSRKTSKGAPMSMTFTGCVESVNHGAMFLLTRVDTVGVESMHSDMSMKQHDGTAMKADEAKAMDERTPMVHEQTDATASKSFVLAGSPSPSKYVGQLVSVTGLLSNDTQGTMHQDVSTLTIKTLKVIAKSCS